MMFSVGPAMLALAVVLTFAATACSSSPNGPATDAARPAGERDGSVDAAVDAAAENADAAADATDDATDAATDDATDATTLLDGGPRCPRSFTARAEGDTCFSVVSACDYPEGRCGCLVCEVDSQSFGYVWACRPWASGGAGCPARSPPIGSACDSPGEQCRYGAYCSVSVGDNLECKEGTWQPAAPLEACGHRMCTN